MPRYLTTFVIVLAWLNQARANDRPKQTQFDLPREINAAILRAALRIEGPPTRTQVRSLRSLVYSLDEAAVPVLMEAMKHKSVYPRRNTLVAMHGLKSPSLALLNARMRMDTSDYEFKGVQEHGQIYQFHRRFPDAVEQVYASAALERGWFDPSHHLILHGSDRFPAMTASVVALASRKAVEDHRLAAQLLRYTLPSADSRTVVRQLFDSPEAEVRRFTAWSICEWKTNLDDYFEDIRKQIANEKDPHRGRCFEALARMPKHRAEAAKLIKSELATQRNWDEWYSAFHGICDGLMTNSRLASDCVGDLIKNSPSEIISIMFVIRGLERLDPITTKYLLEALKDPENGVKLEVTLETILKLDPKLKDWGSRILSRLRATDPDSKYRCLTSLAKAPPPEGAVPVVTKLLKDADPLVRCTALNCLLEWKASPNECAEMLKAQSFRSGEDARHGYFLQIVEQFLDRPGVADAILEICGCTDLFAAEEAVYLTIRHVVLNDKPVPKLPPIRVKDSKETQMYLDWLRTAHQKPRGSAVRAALIKGMDAEFDSDRYWATRLMLLSDTAIWPTAWEVKRLIALEHSDLNLPLLEEMLKRHPSNR